VSSVVCSEFVAGRLGEANLTLRVAESMITRGYSKTGKGSLSICRLSKSRILDGQVKRSEKG
jgi:hypothetical protein